MKNSFKRVLMQLGLALLCLSALLRSSEYLYAQSTTEPEQMVKVYLPVVTNGAVTEPQNNTGRRLVYQVGSTYRFQWEAILKTESISKDVQNTQEGGNTARLGGLVDLQILEQDIDGAYLISLAVRNPLIIASQHDEAASAINDPTITTALATPLLFKQARTGEILEIRYAQDVPVAMIEIQKGIVNLLQVTLREDEQYTVEEQGGQGHYRSHYTVRTEANGLLVSKTISENDFIEMVSAGTPEAKIQLENRVDMLFDAAQGTPQSIHVVEEIMAGDSHALAAGAEAVPSAASVEIKVTSEGWLRFLQAQPTESNPVMAASAHYIQGSLRANLNAGVDLEETIDLSTVQIDGELQTLEQNPTDATQVQRMADLIRQDSSHQILNTIATRMSQVRDEPQLNGYIDLLSMAATPDAQRVLSDLVLMNEQTSNLLKMRALTQLADVKQPSAQLVERVLALSQSNNPALHALSLLTLGGLANSLQSSDSQAANRLATDLTSRLQQATSDEERELLLLAVGNAGIATTESTITVYLSNRDPNLRGAATLALRKLPISTVDGRLVESLYQESSAYVQEMAAIALSHRLATPGLRTAAAEQALQSYATVAAAAVDGVWAKTWNKSFSAGPVTINLPGDVTIKGAPALTLDANQAANGSVMGINFNLFRAKLLSDAPSGARRFGAYFWIGGNTLIWSYEATAPCSFTKSGVLWEGSKEFFSFSKSIPVYEILVVTLKASARGYAKITYDYQQQLCNANAAAITGKITPQAAITAQGSAYLELLLLRGGVVLTADILKTTIPAQASASLTTNGGAAPILAACVDIRATVEPLSGKLTASAERRKYIIFGSWKSLGSWDIWKFAVNGQSYTLLAECLPVPTPVCFPEYPTLPVIVGTTGNDPALNGTAASERICGLTGNDVLNGQDGNDVMGGNQGQDTLNGGLGNDNMHGGQDNDTVNGNEGNDSVVGGLGDDTVYGNQGADTVYGGEGNDIVGGGQDNDNVYGEAGNDALYGGLGNDNLWGGPGNDQFYYTAGQGNDIIYDFQWSIDRLRLEGVTISGYTQLGADCQVNLSNGATLRLINVGTCRSPL